MQTPKFRSSCDSCLRAKVKCEQTRPSCSRCDKHGQKCVYSHCRKIGRPSLSTCPSFSEQANTRRHRKPIKEHRHAHSSKKLRPLKLSESRKSPLLSYGQTGQWDLQNKGVLPETSTPAHGHTYTSVPFMESTSAVDQQFQSPQVNLPSPLFWDPSLEPSHSISNTNFLAAGHGDSLAVSPGLDLTAPDMTYNLSDLPMPCLSVLYDSSELVVSSDSVMSTFDNINRHPLASEHITLE